MNRIKEASAIEFAIFVSIFGVGKLILPPFLGFNAGNDCWLVTLEFLISAVITPILAVLAHARTQWTIGAHRCLYWA
ncbi:branched-chain amino acid transport system II carrier protein [Maribacter antarcticus]|uniref:branched-chain amino acid transport system II carrier protein n=1 Tax=Maribacter antarcticus TaxID=505250 RepID=UPI00047ECB08|nr:branched-chain amino acid transport system II carrier protein [Maribacter antarcticus]